MQQKRRKRNWGRDSENIRKDEVKEIRQKERVGRGALGRVGIAGERERKGERECSEGKRNRQKGKWWRVKIKE